jgi:hypothetical protein
VPFAWQILVILFLTAGERMMTERGTVFAYTVGTAKNGVEMAKTAKNPKK